MRIYEGAPRQKYEEVLRSVGAILDQRGMREISLAETDDGFVLQGLAIAAPEDGQWRASGESLAKHTIYLADDDMARFMDVAVERRDGRRGARAPGAGHAAGFYELALRVLGAYIDRQQPRDVFFFEQERQFVLRLLMPTRAGLRHVLVEFTADEISTMIAGRQRERGR